MSVGFASGRIENVTLLLLEERNDESYPVYAESGINRSSDALRDLLQEPLARRLSNLFSTDRFLPAHVVLSGRPVFVATSLNSSEGRREDMKPLVPVMWRTEKPTHENLWHFVHEATEIELKLAGVREPRWLVEGLSQYAAYVYFKRHYPDWLEYVWRHYLVNEQADTEEFFNWGYKGLAINSRTTSGGLKDVLAWAVGQHATEDERKLYGAALKIFVDSFSGREEPGRLIEIAKSGLGGIKWIQENLKLEGS
ncbi:hypothetical protein [Oceanithermus sp.]